MIKQIFCFFYLFFILISNIWSLEFNAHIDKKIMSLDESITVTFRVSGQNIKKMPPYPQILKNRGDFKFIDKNHSQSSSQNITIVNGKMQKTITNTYIYFFTFRPQKHGELYLPPFSFQYKNFKKDIAPTKINVLKESPQSKNIDFKLKFSSRSLYLNEQVLLNVIIQKKVNSNIHQIGMPDIEKELKKYFWIKRTTDKVKGTVKNIKGEPYEVYSIKYIVFPITSGKIKIPSVSLPYTVILRQKRGSRDPFFDDSFFSSFFESTSTSSKTKYSKPVILNVKPLPENGKPDNFNGAVGDFNIKANADKNQIKAGEALNLTVSVFGKGNDKNIQSLDFVNNQKFEVFDPEIKTDIKVKNNNVYINKIFRYVVIPQVQGSYDIGPIILSFFNTKKNQYESCSTSVNINVLKGKEFSKKSERYLTKEEIKLLGKDIRYIKVNIKKIKDYSSKPYKSNIYIFICILPLVLLIILTLSLKQKEQMDQNIEFRRLKKAKRKAEKTLSIAFKQIKHSAGGEFFATLTKSLSEYIADKFNVSAAGLTNQSIEKLLIRHNIDDKTIKEILDFFEQCDMYRFGSLISTETERQKFYQIAETIITRLEKKINK